MLKVLYKIGYWVLVVIVSLILIAVILQRVSNNTISLGGFRIFNVITASMEPKYVVGDVLLSKTVEAEEIEVGDDVVYLGEKGEFRDRIVTHQVIEIEKEDNKYIFHTKGLANEEKDPPILANQIYGVIIAKVPVLSQITKVINNLYSFYFVIFVPMVLLIFIQVRRMIINTKEDKQAKRDAKRGRINKTDDEEEEKDEKND